MTILRYLDLVLLALALPVFLVGGFPMLGFAAGALAWLLQRVIQVSLDRKAREADDLRRVAGLQAGSMIGRGWLSALILFGTGMIDNDSGLAGAVLVVVLFTAYFAVNLAMRPFDAHTRELPS
jgi:hypothetical protein